MVNREKITAKTAKEKYAKDAKRGRSELRMWKVESRMKEQSEKKTL